MKTRFLPLSSLLLTFLTFCTILSASAQVPSYVPTNGLVGYWPFNGNANDESGNGNNGTVNGATLTADRFNNSNSAYLSIPANGSSITGSCSSFPSGDQARSISMWYNGNDLGNGCCRGAFGYGGASCGQSFNVNFENQDVGIGKYEVQGHCTAFRQVLDYSLPVNNSWHHLLITYNGSNLKFYQDGQFVFQSPAVSLNTVVSGKVFNLLGGVDESGTVPYYVWGWTSFPGKIDDIGVWNRELTESEIAQLYVVCNVTPIAIAGNNAPGAFSTSNYNCDNNAGSTYNWTVSNGVIASGQGTNSVSILWGAEGVGSVSVVETTADGCVGDAVVFDVNVQCVVSGNAIEGPVGPEAFSNSTYTCNGAANSTYQWTITNGVIVSGQGTSSVTVLWASTGIGNISVVETTAEGCVGTTLSQDVVVVPVSVEEFTTAISLFPNPATTELNLQTTAELIGSDVIIFDALGKQIHKQQIISTSTRINTSAFAAGNYVVKVGGGVKKFTVEK